MKLFLAIIIIVLNSALGFGQVAEFSVDKAVFKFSETDEGEVLRHVYVVTNTGDTPLIISDYKVSCSCTKALLPNQPILPGESFDLLVTFDTKGKYYFQDRIIYLTTNSKKGVHKVRFKVNVIPKEN